MAEPVAPLTAPDAQGLAVAGLTERFGRTLAVDRLDFSALQNVALLVALPVGIVSAVIAGAIVFANWRIEGNGLVYAREERQ